MAQILLNSASFVFIIILAYVLKRFGLFGPKDYKIITKLTLNVTLPAAILTSFAAFEADPSLFLCILIGFGMNWLILGIAFVLSIKKDIPTRMLWLNCSPGYNIGSFALPFVQSFLPPASVVACCLFDAGSAVMCTGGTYALTCGLTGKGNHLSVRQIGKNLVTSVPFMTYMVMILVTFTGIPIPRALVNFVSPIAKANPFLAMFMIGSMFEIHIPHSKVMNIVKILAVRVGSALLAALGCYFLLPLPLQIRQAMAIAVCAPISVAATALAEKAGADPAEAGCLNSLSIPISIACIITLLVLFGSA